MLSGNLQTHFIEAGKELPKAVQDTISYSDANVQWSESGRERFDDGFKQPTALYKPNRSVERAYSVVGCCHLDGDNMQIV